MPIFQKASLAAPGGFSAAGLARTVQIESGGDPNAGAGTSHVGLTQFSDGTWRQYGQGSRTDPEQSVLAAARYSEANASALQGVLGRAPTDAELYLAHQQGPAGAAKLLANPNARAGDLVGNAAIRGNGGDPNAPASAFTNKWIAKFNSASPSAGPAATKADAYKIVMDDPELRDNPVAQAHAIQRINQTYLRAQVAAEEDTRARKEANDIAANGYVSKMLAGGNIKEVVDAIPNDPNLTWETKLSLSRAAEGYNPDDAAKWTKEGGPGFWNVYKSINAPAGDPNKITDPTELMKRAGPDGDLTLAGVAKLTSAINESRKSVQDSQVHDTKVSLLKYAQGNLSFDQELLFPGLPPAKDQKGVEIFNGKFIPKFEAAYDKWVKDGKDPWAFLTQDNVDKLMVGMRSKSEMAAARIAATGEAHTPAETSTAPFPMPPEGVDQNGWATIVKHVPILPNGQASTHAQWAEALKVLEKSPTPETMAAFDRWFGGAGYKAEDVLGQLHPRGQ